VGEFHKGILSYFTDSSEEEWMVGILRGGFVISHELSNLVKKQERYGRYS
jgi:hypothetical protein